MKIWKWTLQSAEVQTIEVPRGAKFLSVQVKDEMPQLWALCGETTEYEPRKIAIYATGHTIPDDPGKYISTFLMHNGTLVFHAFEVTG
jgi:hypothetical protein